MTWSAAETWGINGSDFSRAYLVLALVALGASWLWWRRHIARPAADAVGRLDPIELAYVSGGRRRALYTALAALRVAGAIELGRRDRLVVRPPSRAVSPAEALHADSHALVLAVSAALAEGRAADRLHRVPAVAAVLRRVRAELQRRRWLRTSRQRWRVRRAGTPLLTVALLGAARVVAGLANHKQVWGVGVVSIAAVSIAAVFATDTPTQTPAATRFLRRLRDRNRHLLPGESASWARKADNAVLGVALFGGAALWTFDATFATAARISNEPFNSGGQTLDATGGAYGSAGAYGSGDTGGSGYSGDVGYSGEVGGG